MIAPTFESLSKQYPAVNFIKCDVDQAKDVAGRYRVTAMYVSPIVCGKLHSPFDLRATGPPSSS